MSLRQFKKSKMTLQIWRLSKTSLSHLKSKKKISRLPNLRISRHWELRRTSKMPLPRIPPPLSVNSKINGLKLRNWLSNQSCRMSSKRKRNFRKSSRKKKNKTNRKIRKKKKKIPKKSNRSKKTLTRQRTALRRN